MFVAEMRDYPIPSESGDWLSRIRLLKDDNGDGKMDSAVTWADNLDHVQGLLPMNGGILATTRTAVLFLKDTDGDDRADEITEVFQQNAPRHNQLQISCPRWGLDNAIYMNNGLDLKEIYPAGNPDQKVSATGYNLRYDPRSNALTTVSSRGQFGAGLDDWNRRFCCTNRNPTIFAVIDIASAQRNPYAMIVQGRILYSQDKFDEAKSKFQQAVEARPDLPAGNVNLGIIDNYVAQDYQAAYQQYQTYVQKNGSRVRLVQQWIDRMNQVFKLDGE